MTGGEARRAFEPGDIVRVRSEAHLSEVVRPSHRRPDCEVDDIPDVEIGCVPIVLVRTPVGSGVLRWVEIRDITAAEDAPESSGDGGNAPG